MPPLVRPVHFGALSPSKIRFIQPMLKNCVWLKRELVAQIEFTEWTPENHLRHSKFVGLREDKEAREVVRRSAKRCPARIILRSAIRLALTTYPIGSVGAAVTVVQFLFPYLGLPISLPF
jgi:hypothetical protein